MLKRSFAILCCLLLLQSLRAADFDVRRFGAKGDGIKMNTEAIQKAIDSCTKAGGGRVILMDGVYLTGPIQLKSGVNLHIDGTACLLASPNINDYHEWPDPKHFISENLSRPNRNTCLIFADEADRISITGQGVIDGNGTEHVTEGKGWNELIKYKRIHPYAETLPRVVFLAGCKDVLISDVTMLNQPAGWSYWIHDCDRVTIRGLQILASLEYPNNDGIHVNCSRDVTISDCHIEGGDDCIIARANSRSLRENKPMERMTVTNCILRSSAFGVRLAWTNDGTIRNCVFSNLVITNSYRGIGMQLPKKYVSDFGREETLIENILFSNIVMTGIVNSPVFFEMSPLEEVTINAVRDIRFSNIQATGKHFPYFHGRAGNCLQNFVFDNCRFVREAEPDQKEPDIFGYTEGFTFNATTFTTLNN